MSYLKDHLLRGNEYKLVRRNGYAFDGVTRWTNRSCYSESMIMNGQALNLPELKNAVLNLQPSCWLDASKYWKNVMKEEKKERVIRTYVVEEEVLIPQNSIILKHIINGSDILIVASVEPDMQKRETHYYKLIESDQVEPESSTSRYEYQMGYIDTFIQNGIIKHLYKV